jgi:competence protein ComEC
LILRKRNTMPALALFALVGIIAGLWIQPPSDLYLSLLLLFGGLAVWWLVGPGPCLLVVGYVLTGLSCHDYLARNIVPGLAGQNLLITGQVVSFPKQAGAGQIFLFATETRGLPEYLPTRVQLRTYAELPHLQLGEFWQLHVRLKPPNGSVNRGVYDRQVWLLAAGIQAVGYVRNGPGNVRLQPQPERWDVHKTRARIRTDIERLAGGAEMLPFILGITVGARDLLQDAHWQILRKTGTNHLLAISGLHIALVSMGLWYAGIFLVWVLAMCGLHNINHVPAHLLVVGGAFTYAMLAGFSLPTLRALSMVLLVLLHIIFQRMQDRFAVLACALLGVVVWQPLSVLSPAFWLSFTAVTLLFLSVTRRSADPESVSIFSQSILLKGIAGLLRTQWILGVGLAVPMCLFFGQLSLVAPLANLIAVPLFTFLILPASLTGVLLGTLLPEIAEICFLFATIGLQLLLQMLEWLAAIPFSSMQGVLRSPLVLIPALLAISMLLLPRPFFRPVAAGLMLLLSMGLNSTQEPTILRISVLDVGQGLAVLVQTKGHLLLYDTGPGWPGGDAGAQMVIPVLNRMGVEHIDLLVVSHTDNDHSGGMYSILEAVDVDALLGPPEFVRSKQQVFECRRSLHWTWDGVAFRVLHPRDRVGWSDNNASCVLQVSIGEHSMLLPGDIETEAEQVLLSRADLIPAELVVAPHHGSRTSSSNSLVSFLQPAYVVFATGFMNRWGFPVASVTDRWETSGACLLNTAQTGGLTFEFVENHGFELKSSAADNWLRPWAVRTVSVAECKQA